MVAFYRDYKRIGVAKGDERHVVGCDGRCGAVLLDDGKGGTVAWRPAQIGGARGGTEVYRSEGIELRAGDRIRWTRNDDGLGVVNSRTAEVLGVANGRASRSALRTGDGSTCAPAIRNSAISTTRGRRPCTLFRGAPSTT